MTPQPDTHAAPTHCPYLGTESSTNRLSEAVEYPSFENRCWTATRPIPLLLTDQATLCLCSGHLNCPRFLAARAARHGQERPATIPPPADADSISNAIKELEADVQAATVAQTKSRRRWGWIGAGIIFMSSVLCGGLFAAYVGWQLVREEVAMIPPGQIDTLAAPAQAQTGQQPQTFIIVTATSEPQVAAIAQAPSTTNGQITNNGTASTTQSYPEAVPPTPTPLGGAPQAAPPSLSEIADETNANFNATQVTPEGLPQVAPAPTLNFDLAVPTRRPTPFLDIPTSTPGAEATPTLAPTPTPMPPLGTPLVMFYAEDKTMELGDCFNVYWHVENVKAVYYENIGVDGRGQKEECVRDDEPGEYNLMVIHGNGATQWYTVTVGVILPTDTPAPTPTRTTEPEPTATWTPSVPTATPTPPVTYGARLEANGDTDLTCSRGNTCEVNLSVSNTGSAADSITVRFTEMSSWPSQLCRLDGVCSSNQMTFGEMGVGNTASVRLIVTIPQDAPSETMTYKAQAVSENSGGSVTSRNVAVAVTVTDAP